MDYKKKLKLIARNLIHRALVWNTPKVFCIGFNKTGTTSLLHSLKAHGYIFGNFGQGERLIDSYSIRDFGKIVDYCRYGSAVKDVPLSLPQVFIALDQSFPKSKFILTIRDNPDQWYESITRFHSITFGNGTDIPTYNDLINCVYCYRGWAWKYIHECYGTDIDDPYNKSKMIQCYERHLDDVEIYFRNRRNDLLVINVAERTSYHKMCEFLHLDPLSDEFPWRNKTNDRRK
jgi:hypothetical protein